jgi:hypothetical protein
MSQSKYTIRATIACPEDMISDGNQFALAIGESMADDKTFGPVRWQDDLGNRYSVVSTVAVEHFPLIAQADIANLAAMRPWLEEGAVDIAAAEAAQAALVVWSPKLATPVPETDSETGTGEASFGELVLGPQATLGAITAVVHPDPKQAIDWLGLSPIPIEDPE